MIKGTIKTVKEEAFTSKAGNPLFKVGIMLDNDQWYNTISKFEKSVKKGDKVQFETESDKPNSIVLGTLRKIKEYDDVLLNRIVDLEGRVKDLETAVAKL